MTREEAINTVRNIYQTDKEKEALKILIPELAKSEDEKIKEAIEGTIRVYGKTQGAWIGGYDMDTLVIHLREAFDALEKQKEQKQKIKVRIPKFRVGDIIQHVPLERWDSTKKITSIDEHGYNYNLSHLGDTVSGGAIGFAFENEYELVEQKPAEWSEEDEKIFENFMHKLEVCDLLTNKEIRWAKLRLKSLHPQPSWKSSEEGTAADLDYWP